jgi:hypothetical protein
MIIEKSVSVVNQPFAMNPASIDVPKNTKSNMITTSSNMRKHFMHRDLYKFGPMILHKIYLKAALRNPKDEEN